MQNRAIAQNNLGFMYEHGFGVARNPDVALGWYQKAALQGSKAAALAVARLTAVRA